MGEVRAMRGQGTLPKWKLTEFFLSAPMVKHAGPKVSFHFGGVPCPRKKIHSRDVLHPQKAFILQNFEHISPL